MNRYDRVEYRPGVVGWSYRYMDAQPRSKLGEVSTGLELAVQLSGTWHHEGMRNPHHGYGPGELFTISPGERYNFAFAAPDAPIDQVGFIVYPDEVSGLACDDRQIVFPPGVIADRELVELCRDLQRELDRESSILMLRLNAADARHWLPGFDGLARNEPRARRGEPNVGRGDERAVEDNGR